MVDLRPILFVLGILLTTLAVAMVVPMLADLAVLNQDWEVFAVSAAFCCFIGVMLILTCRAEASMLSIRQAFILTTSVWVALPAFAAIPFTFANLDLDYADAFFEAMSGLTTTGSTVLIDVESAPPGILLWRSLLQWLGGVGIVMMAVSVLPLLQVGGMQLFRMEFSDRIEKTLPRAAQIAAWIGGIYVFLTMVCGIFYFVLGMSSFDAVNHAMTTLATGGFSTRNMSLGYFDHSGIDAVATLFMILGSLPFLLYFQMLRGGMREFFRDSQVQWFAGLLAAAMIMLVFFLVGSREWSLLNALRYASFNATSIMTGTGYATDDFSAWGAFATPLFFVLMFIGGCAGSTTCGIKVFRIQVLFATAQVQFRRLLQPNGVFIAYYNGKPITDRVAESVMSFFFLFAIIFALLALGLGAAGLDFISATSGAATAIANVGPGLGSMIGPHGSFASLPESAKWMLSLGMLIGRLEIFTVLALLSPRFWRV